jgi:O-antigen/teichoic acid export membrane protein
VKQLIQRSSIYTLGNILPQAVNYFLLPVLTRYLSPYDFGILSSMQALSAILLVFFTVAFDRALPRMYYDYESEDRRKTLLGTIFFAILIASTVLAVVLFLARGLVARMFRSIPFFPYYAYTIGTAFVIAYSLVPKATYRILGRAGTFFTFSIAQFVLPTIIVLVNVVALRRGAVGFVEARFFGNLILLPVFLLSNRTLARFKLDFGILKKCVRFSLPFVPTLISAWALNLSNRIFLERYLSLDEVGIYSLGLRIAQVAILLQTGINAAYNPFFYKTASELEAESAKKILYKYNAIYMMVGVYLAFAVVMLSKEAIQLFIDARYLRAHEIIPVISISYLFNSGSGLTNLFIYQVKKSSKVMTFVLIGAVINVVLNVILIPRMGAFGAAYSSLISFFSVFVMKYAYARRAFFIPFDWKLIGVAVVISVALVLFFSYSVKLPPLYLFVVKGVTVMAAGFGLFLRIRAQWRRESAAHT